jgi:CO/xanthine dehydrogenase FAD-binding subunit
MTDFTHYFAPDTLDEAIALLGEHGETTRVIAGGTDVMVRVRRGLVPETETTLLSVHRVAEMAGVRVDGDELVIGALATAAELHEDSLIRTHVPILSAVADRLASRQIRNLATVGGNLANASPAGDLINPLLLLDAEIVLAAGSGERRVPITTFFTGPGETVRCAHELLTEIRVAIPPPDREFRFEKAGTRPAMECSVVTVGLAWTPRDGMLTDVRVAFGSLAPFPMRGRATETVLEGFPNTEETRDAAADAAASEVSPISDVRGSAAYRRVLAGEFVRRLLDG